MTVFIKLGKNPYIYYENIVLAIHLRDLSCGVGIFLDLLFGVSENNRTSANLKWIVQVIPIILNKLTRHMWSPVSTDWDRMLQNLHFKANFISLFLTSFL